MAAAIGAGSAQARGSGGVSRGAARDAGNAVLVQGVMAEGV